MIEAQPVGELVGAAFVQRGAARRREVLTARVAEIRLGRTQVVPVGLRLDAEPFDGDEPRSTPSSRWMTRSDCS